MSIENKGFNLSLTLMTNITASRPHGTPLAITTFLKQFHLRFGAILLSQENGTLFIRLFGGNKMIFKAVAALAVLSVINWGSAGFCEESTAPKKPMPIKKS